MTGWGPSGRCNWRYSGKTQLKAQLNHSWLPVANEVEAEIEAKIKAEIEVEIEAEVEAAVEIEGSGLPYSTEAKLNNLLSFSKNFSKSINWSSFRFLLEELKNFIKVLVSLEVNGFQSLLKPFKARVEDATLKKQSCWRCNQQLKPVLKMQLKSFFKLSQRPSEALLKLCKSRVDSTVES